MVSYACENAVEPIQDVLRNGHGGDEAREGGRRWRERGTKIEARTGGCGDTAGKAQVMNAYRGGPEARYDACVRWRTQR